MSPNGGEFPAQPEGRPRSQGGPAAVWLVPFGLLVSAIVAVPLHLFDEQGWPRHQALSAELREIEAENGRLTREVRELRTQVDALRRDPRAVERIARDELGMVKADELIFQFAP